MLRINLDKRARLLGRRSRLSLGNLLEVLTCDRFFSIIREAVLSQERNGGKGMENNQGSSGGQNEYFVVKAKENGVHVIGLTRGQDTRFHHTEKLDKGEVMIAQFTEHTSAVKVRGKAIVMTKFGTIDTEE
jgi:transcription attenuation protein (tryptophan RNA-binding attenuator protein)